MVAAIEIRGPTWCGAVLPPTEPECPLRDWQDAKIPPNPTPLHRCAPDVSHRIYSSAVKSPTAFGWASTEAVPPSPTVTALRAPVAKHQTPIGRPLALDGLGTLTFGAVAAHAVAGRHNGQHHFDRGRVAFASRLKHGHLHPHDRSAGVTDETACSDTTCAETSPKCNRISGAKWTEEVLGGSR